MNKRQVWADLHCHSTCSDGSITPEELIQLGKKYGLKGLSITDHDTIDAYSQAIPVAKSCGIRLGTGIEFSCHFENFNIHLLGYDFDLNSPKIYQACSKRKKSREERNKKMLVELKKHGCPLDYEELVVKAKTSSIGRPHIAMLMLEKGYIKTYQEAFSQYIGEGKKCYQAGFSLDVAEAIEIIRGSMGKVFIAHPHLLPFSFPLQKLLALPFDGIECCYAHLKATPWLGIAQDKGWLISGGSDYHGSLKTEIDLGCNGVLESEFHAIFSKLVA